MSSWNPNIMEYASCQQQRSGDDRNFWCLNCQNNLSKRCKKVKPINQFAYRFGQIIRSELSEPLPSNNNNRLTPVRKTSSFLDDPPNLHNSNLYAPTPSLTLVDFLRSYYVFRYSYV